MDEQFVALRRPSIIKLMLQHSLKLELEFRGPCATGLHCRTAISHSAMQGQCTEVVEFEAKLSTNACDAWTMRNKVVKFINRRV